MDRPKPTTRPPVPLRPSHGTEVIVIGAGVIGLTIALTLADEGRRVVIIDPEMPVGIDAPTDEGSTNEFHELGSEP